MILDLVATVALSPVLLVQALRLRKRALRLPEATGPRNGTTGSPIHPPLRLLVTGDSSAAGVGAHTQREALTGQLTQALSHAACVQWRLVASTGATTASTLARLRASPPPAADIVVVVLGVNDVTGGVPLGRWLRQHAALRALLRSATGASRLYICQIPPMGAFPLLPSPLRWVLGRRAGRFDTALRGALVAEPDTRYVPLPQMMAVADMAEDGFHPGPKIYATWAHDMARQIGSDGPLS